MNSKQLKILLAEDDQDDRDFFDKMLKDIPISTHLVTVYDGEQLMNYLYKNSEHLPNVLFLDLNMPLKNGFECLSEIKLSKMLNQLPVIIFSTSFEQEVVNQLYQNGAQFFIRKPSEFSQYKKIIQQSLILIAQKNILQPTSGNFVITVQNSLII
jgi:CheY-like chemotaxis protein